MGEPKRSARELLRTWRELRVPPSDSHADAQRRERVVAATAAAIAQAGKERAGMRRRIRASMAVFAAAAAIAIFFFWSHRRHAVDLPPVVAPVAQSPGFVAPSLATIESDGGDLLLPDGVRITLRPKTRFHGPEPRLANIPAPPGERVRLDVGAIDVRVPPMPPGQSFSVETPDAVVTVHGTAFVVEVDDPPAKMPQTSLTHVRVQSGVVSVASAGRETLLTAGMEWPSPPSAENPPAGVRIAPSKSIIAPSPSAPAAVASHSNSPDGISPHDAISAQSPAAPQEAPARPVETPRASTLAEENRLLAAAMDASRAGDEPGALRALDELLRRFPASPLAQEAHIQRFRALSRMGEKDQAAHEARLYLALYPNGSARDEAKEIAVAP